MYLNEEYSFHDVRYPISRRVSPYDVGLSFVGEPRKELLPAGTRLIRLDYQHAPISDIFTRVWWMRRAVFERLLSDSESARELRARWQQGQAMPKSAAGLRTLVVEIELMEPVYAWVGLASPLFHKAGGLEQVYLPNLAHDRIGPNRSRYARLVRIYTLPPQ
ncbi:MAG: hypothetical protein RMI94_12155 [Bryobacterales bacterium]|nr:hypothetical protein [Bryobacteraceae bacterium]MDW8131298.1 hypothetical protein [Bryobacterales bacterium]